MYPAAISISSRVWETAAFMFLVVPLTILWIISLADTVWRKDLAHHQKALWFAVVVLFPVVGTLVYLLRRPGWAERAISLRQERPLLESQQQAVETLTNLAVTLDMTRLTLRQSTELLQQITDVLSDAGETANFALPLTRFRPLGPVESRVKKLMTQVRSLGFTMEQMAASVGTNAGDLRSLARRLDRQQLTTSQDGDDAPLSTTVEEAATVITQPPPRAAEVATRIRVRGPRTTDNGPDVTLEPNGAVVSSPPGGLPGEVRQ